MLFPKGFRGELAQYIGSQKEKEATHLFESKRFQPYSTRPHPADHQALRS